MKKLKRLTAMLLAFVMVLAFAACGKPDSNAAGKSDSNAVGTWSMKMDLSQALKEEMGAEFADFDAPFSFTVYLDLNKKGTYKMYLDEAETQKDMDRFMDALADFFTEYLYTVFESNGVDRATAQATLEEQFGMPVNEYARQSMKESIDLTELTKSVTQEGVYEIKDDKFYMGLDKIDKQVYDLITIEGNTMTLDQASDAAASPFLDESIPGLSYPFVLTKVK